MAQAILHDINSLAPPPIGMAKAFFADVSLLPFLVGSCSREPAPSVPPISKFHAGQTWAFTTPQNQPNAKLIVLRVENGGKIGTIVHIALSGVSYGHGETKINHLPFAESAVERSVTTLEQESGPIPDFAEGYGIWRKAFDAGKGGVFTITVAEAFNAVTGIASDHK